MKISIAMATYNGAKYIKQQLQSFVDQTCRPDEVVITDDCSTDGTDHIVHDFAKTAPFKVEFYCNDKNLGYCGNFNAALKKTTGDLVFLSDQDDVWFPNKIEKMLGVAEGNPEALVIMNDAALTDAALNKVGLTKIGQIRSAGLAMESFVMGCCCVVRRELLDMCLPIPDAYKAHDNWIVGFADGLNAKTVVDMPLQYYRRHEANESKFIANRTTRVSRQHAFSHGLKSVFSSDVKEHSINYRKQLLLLLQGIRSAQMVADEKYQESFLNFFNATQGRLDTLERRMQIREKSPLPRLFSALSFFFQGGYRNVSGVKSVVRDIIRR